MFLVFSFAEVPERDKFEYIFNKYKKLMLHKAYEILGDYQLAEDAASEAFIRIYKNLHKVGDPDSLRTAAFVVTIVRNVAITLLGWKKSHEAQELDELHNDGFDLEEEVLSRVSAEKMHRLIGSIREEYRGVFLLKYAYELSHREIGEMLGISENNVTVRLHRAKKSLAKLLRQEGYVNE